MNDTGSLGSMFRLVRPLAKLILVMTVIGVPQLHGARSSGRQVSVPGSSVPSPAKETSAAAIPEQELSRALELRRKLLSRDLHEAVPLVADSSLRFRKLGRLHDAAIAEVEAGDIYQMMSAYRQALDAYRRALSISSAAQDGGDQRCLAQSRIVRTYANIGRAQEAQKYANEMQTLCKDISDGKIQSAVLEAQGEVSYWSFRMKEAEVFFLRARDLALSAGDRNGEALATMMLAEAINGNDKKESARLAWSALESFVASGNEYDAARAHMSLAFFADGEGDFDRAQCHSRKALKVFEGIGDKDNAAIALNSLGRDARLSGDLDDSTSDYRHAQREFAAVRDDLGEAESILGLSHLLVGQKDYAGLRSLALRELYLGRKTSNRSLIGYGLMWRAAADAHQHRYAQADEEYQEALAQATSAENVYGKALALMRRGELQFEQHRLNSALALFDQALALKVKSGEPTDIARIHYFRARIHFLIHEKETGQSEMEAAKSEIEATIAIVESQRLRIASFDTRAQYFAFVHEYYSFYIRVLMGLDKQHRNQGYARQAFEAAEKSKVRGLLDLLASTQHIPACEVLLALHTDSAPTLSIQDSADETDGIAAEALTVDQFQSVILDGRTVLLEYALGEEQSFAWLVDQGNVTAFDLGPAAKILNSIRLFREALLPVAASGSESPTEYLRRRQAAINGFQLQATTLAKLLLGPIHLPPGKRLLIVPDGALQYLPFAALPDPGRISKSIPLIQEHELTMLPSASVLVALRKAALKRTPPKDEVTVFADPVFHWPEKGVLGNIQLAGAARSRELTTALLDSRDTAQIPNLPGSRTEANAIREILGRARTRLALGFEANRGTILGGSLARQKMIHFATHGILDTRHPEMSGLVLSMFDKRGTYQDGYLRLSDIYHLRLSADLVILSSCDSALGKDLGSEGIVGLPRGFLYAGARRVIASLWKVDDEASVTIMKALYSRLQQGSSAAAALRGAQLELLRDKQFSAPYYWAGFILEGDFQ